MWPFSKIDFFGAHQGRKQKPWQKWVYTIVNYWIPNFFGLLFIMAFFGIPIYVIMHFIIKYW